jgi:multiple sugar transport system permease protein
MSGVATVIVWTYLFSPQFGAINGALRSANAFLRAEGLAWLQLPVPGWITDPAWAKPALLLMMLWGAAGGGGMLIFLAGLQGIPTHLYEAAELEGAGRWRKFWNITLPMLSPTVYFNFVIGIIGAMQIFMQVYVLTGGLGDRTQSLLFYVFYLYKKAFIEYEMGYASALAWILFLVILALTMAVIRSSPHWVYYEAENR